MSGFISVSVPCRLVTLKVVLGPEIGLTTLEDLVARAVAAGRRTVEQQQELFELPTRLIVDVVHSLWSKGHLLVRFDTGELDLTDGARELLAREGLRDAAVRHETRRFLFEPVTGQIFPESRGYHHAQDDSLELPAHEGVTTADLMPNELLEAVRSALRHDRKRYAVRLNVLDVGFGSPVLRPPEELRWLPLRAVVRADAANGDRLSVSILDNEHLWGMRARQRMAEHLVDFAEEQPDHDFTKNLRQRAERGPVEPQTLQSLLSQMGRMVDGLAATDAGQVVLVQEKLTGLARDIAEQTTEADAGRANVTVLERVHGYAWAIEDLIAQAEIQLVICSPVINYATLNHLLPLLEERLDKGLNLVVFWGRSASDTLTVPVLTAFHELMTRYRGQVIVGERSAQTDACVVVQDGRRAFFGSISPLVVDVAKDHGEIGILVEPAQDGPGTPRCISDALRWARKTYPYAAEGARIQLQPGQPGGPADADAPTWNQAEHLPAGIPVGAGEATIRLWADQWSEHYAGVLAAVRDATDGTPSVELVRDSAHRALIDEMLTTRATRLAITDDRIDPRIANDAMARQIRELANAGASVHLVHPRTTVSGNVGLAFAELASAQEAGIHVQHRHAGVRAVLSGDSVLLGSFSPLSEGGRARGHGRIGQLGIHVKGAVFADAFAAVLRIPGSAAVDDPADAPPPPGTRRSSRATSVALPLLEQAKKAHGPDGFTAVIRERIIELDDPWAVLDQWVEAKVPAAELRRGAALILGLGRSVDGPREQQWVSWLVADAWQRHAFIEAAVVGRLLSSATDVAASTAAAVLEVGPLGEMLVNAALSLADTDSQARVAGAVGGMAESLLRGGPDGPEVTAMLLQTLPGHWRHLAEAATERDAGRALPLGALKAALTQASDQAAAADTWDRLAAQIDHLEQLRGRYDFESGKVMHNGLFAADGPLTAIRDAARDPERRPDLLNVLPGNLRRHIEDLVTAAGKPPIAWRTQNSLLRRLETIVGTARELAANEMLLEESASNGAELGSCRRLGAVLVDRWDDLFSELAQVGAAGSVDEVRSGPLPYHLTMRALLEQLRPLHEWAREQR